MTNAVPGLFDVPFTPTEAARSGLTRRDLDREVRHGTVVRLVRGVYLGAHVPLDRDTRARAVALVIGGRPVLSGRTAAWLHGCAADALLVGEPTGRGVPIEVWPGGRAPAGILRLGRLRVVPAVTAAADLASRLPAPAALAVLDGMLRARSLRRDELTGPGAPVSDALAAACDERADGPAESVLRWHWLAARLPTPSPGARVAGSRMALALPVHRFGVVMTGAVDGAVLTGWATRGWRVLALDRSQVLRTDGALVREHLEREFHQHLLAQVDAAGRGAPL
jgi:hypothetical protein